MAHVAEPQPLDVRDLLQIAWRRAWVLLLPVVVIGGASALLAKVLPSVYRSSSLIVVEKPRVGEQYVKTGVPTALEDRLAASKQEILSARRLEAIITELDLYRDERQRQDIDQVVRRMRRAVDVEVKSPETFVIAYRGTDPATVQAVTNRLAALYVEENSREREERAADTSRFLESQLVALRDTLAVQERRVREFKDRFLGELPEQREANLRELDHLHLQSQSLADQIRAAEQRRLLLQLQLSQTPREQLAAAVGGGRAAIARRGGVSAPDDGLLARLEDARHALAQLEAQYTPRHPDVVQARRQLEELEARTARAGTADGAMAPAGPSPGHDDVPRVPNPMYRQIEAQVAAVDQDLHALRQGQRQLAARIPLVQRRLENAPRLEQQLAELTRDYEHTRRTYDSLLARKLEAQIAENLEKRQKGEQFRVVEPAGLPQAPHGPNRWLILLGGLAFGVAAGAGGAYGLEMLDHSLRRPQDLREVAPQLTLLGAVPVIRSSGEAWRRRLLTLAAVLLVVALGATALGFAWRHSDVIIRSPVTELFLR